MNNMLPIYGQTSHLPVARLAAIMHTCCSTKTL